MRLEGGPPTRADTSMTRAMLAVAPAFLVASCDPIVAQPLSDAPLNACPEFPCDRYDRDSGRTAARCRERGRCEIPTAGERPEFPFWILVHVPESSIFAPGMTYVFFSDDRGEPAFRRQTEGTTARRCTPPQCLELGGLTAVTGRYIVTRVSSVAVGYPLPDRSVIPVRAVFEPIGAPEAADPFGAALPLDRLFGGARLVTDDETGQLVPAYSRAMPSARYRRILYPEPPFDAYFPPTIDEQLIKSGNFSDRFVLGLPRPQGKLLDDVSTTSRVAEVSRGDGLDGWRLWLIDPTTRNRVSVVRTLEGESERVRLDTTGIGLGDDLAAVLAPPDTWTAVPRLESPLFGGSGLQNLNYPPLPPPVTVNGVVAQPGPTGPRATPDGRGTLLGYPARLTFESSELLGRTRVESLLHYTTTVSTDDRGRFSTVLPPGTYAVTIEPAEGTGFAKVREPVVVDRAVTTLTLQPPLQPLVRGRAILTDDRPLADAEVQAIPEATVPPTPRPGRTRTGSDGRFVFDGLDPGSYVFTVVPKANTGFPRVVHRATVPAEAINLPDMRVPAPTRLAFRLRDPSPTGNPIVRAIVRILAAPADRAEVPIEIGSAMTDPEGYVEILLAQRPR